MEWFRTEAVFDECDKVAYLESASPKLFEKAITMWLFSGCFCARNSTDGFIPDAKLRRVAPTIARPKPVIQALVDCRLFERVQGGVIMHNYLKYNPSKAAKEKWRGQGKTRQANFRARKNNDGVTPESNAPVTPLVTERGNATPVLSCPDLSCPKEQRDFSAGADASRGEDLQTLEKRYVADLPTGAREACALSRKNGKMADSVWLNVLRRLDRLPVPAVEYAMRQMVEKHGDGDKSEAYMIGIARRAGKNGTPNSGPVKPTPPGNYDFDDDYDKLMAEAEPKK